MPYNIANNLIQNYVSCDKCGDELDLAKTKFDMHVSQKHPRQKNVTYSKVFCNILLVPGLGHMEINLMRGLMPLCKLYCLNYASKCLDFVSSKAQDYISNGLNHHLSWQVLHITMEALAQETMYEFITETPTTVHSAQTFDHWLHTSVKSKSFQLACTFVFECYSALKCFRCGVRKCN